jgi:hypothetical protein
MKFTKQTDDGVFEVTIVHLKGDEKLIAQESVEQLSAMLREAADAVFVLIGATADDDDSSVSR